MISSSLKQQRKAIAHIPYRREPGREPNVEVDIPYRRDLNVEVYSEVRLGCWFGLPFGTPVAKTITT